MPNHLFLCVSVGDNVVDSTWVRPTNLYSHRDLGFLPPPLLPPLPNTHAYKIISPLHAGLHIILLISAMVVMVTPHAPLLAVHTPLLGPIQQVAQSDTSYLPDLNPINTIL